MYDYVPLDHLQRALLPMSSLNGTNQFSQLLPTVMDEMLEDIRVIEELESDEIIFT